MCLKLRCNIVYFVRPCFFFFGLGAPISASQSIGSTALTDPLPTASSDALSTMLDVSIKNTSTNSLMKTSKDLLPRLPGLNKTTLTDPLSIQPTISELQRCIVRHIAPEWHSVGVQMDIEVSVLSIIEADICPRSVEKCCCMMFTRWLAHDEGTGGEPRVWRTVLKALRNAGYKILAGDVESTLFEQN